MRVSRLAALCAASLCIASPALAQKPSGARWSDLLAFAGAGQPLPEWSRRNLANSCARSFPDSVLLATPGPGRAWENGSVFVLTADTTGNLKGWVIAETPTAPDTIRTRVAGVTCSQRSSDAPPEPTLILETEGRYLNYSQSVGYRCRRDCDPFPLLRGFAGDSVFVLGWDAAAGRITGAAALAAERRARLRARGWSATSVQQVMDGRVQIGMTADMVREAWGAPTRINRTGTASRIMEQWVYGRTYVYLTNGRVTAWQD